VLASIWSDILTWTLGAAAAGFLLFIAGLIASAVIVYPFRFLRRTYRVLEATARDYDGDGYRKIRDGGYAPGYHYMAGISQPVYPLAGGYAEQRGFFGTDILWCVTTNYRRDRFWFCKRDGSPFRRLPKRLRGLDPEELFRQLDEAAKGDWRDEDEDEDEEYANNYWSRADSHAPRPRVEPDRTSVTCPECGKVCVGKSGFLQHRKDKHGIPKAAPVSDGI
jgi:hypothetical protein